MSCGCGCCPKCGCRATCTCNNTLWSLESRCDFSYIGNYYSAETAAGDLQYSFNGDNEHSDVSGAADELHGAYAKKGSRGFANNYESCSAETDCGNE